MHVKQFSSVDEFASLVVPVLEASEAENNLALGIMSAVRAGEYREPFFAVVHEGPTASSESIVAVALRTPPFPVLVALTAGAANPEAAQLLVVSCTESSVPRLGALTPTHGSVPRTSRHGRSSPEHRRPFTCSCGSSGAPLFSRRLRSRVSVGRSHRAIAPSSGPWSPASTATHCPTNTIRRT